MPIPKKLYRFIFIYNPASNTIRSMYIFNCGEEGVDFCVKHLSAKLNVKEEIILGKSLAGNYYQLYLERYGGGSQYVREDAASVKKFMNTARIGVAVSKYITENKLWDKVEI